MRCLPSLLRLRFLPLSFIVLACGGSDTHRKTAPADAGFDAGAGGTAGSGADAAAGGASAGGVGSGGREGGAPGSGGEGTTDAALPGTDAGAPRDAGADARTPPDASGDAGADGGASLVGKDVVYATFNGMLVWLDPASGRRTEVGMVRNAANETQTYSSVSMAWTGSGATALTVFGNLKPTLGTVDLCTGLGTLGPVITRASTANMVVEGIAVAADGTVYVGSGNATQTLSPNLGTLDLQTGVVTALGRSVVSYQNDIDMLWFVGPTLYGMDVDTAANRLDLFTLDASTGANTRVVGPTFPATEVPLRITYSEQRGTAYAWRASDRNLLEYSLATGTPTRALGETYPAGTYANQPSYGFFVAPLPACP